MTETSHLTAVRESYDSVADDYVRLVPLTADMSAVPRAMVAAFIELVADAGPVADLGCGPGRVTAYLAERGVPAQGVDLSPRMIQLARAAHPDLNFTVGSMTALDLPDDHLGGILAWFSTHHTPPERLPTVFGEFHRTRTLAPGGHLLIGTHIGAGERRQATRAYGDNPVSYTSYLLPVEQIAGLLTDAGLTLVAQLRHEAEPPAHRPYAVLLLRKGEGVSP